MRFTRVSDWLDWQQRLHGRSIDLGLERSRFVAKALGLLDPPFAMVSVAGTNGKGTCIAALEAVLLASGYRVGVYTSPHLLRYNERIRVDGVDISDPQLLTAFDNVDKARGQMSLTFFEFGTLAAMDCFRRAAPDIVLLEVGLGGRLDAVNVFDADVAVITSIDIDHSELLGEDRFSIGREKAGIIRAGAMAVCADVDVPQSVEQTAAECGCTLYKYGVDFNYRCDDNSWEFTSGERVISGLPRPVPGAAWQYRNVAAALMALDGLGKAYHVSTESIRRALGRCVVPGRLQTLRKNPECIVDVGHNPAAGAGLAQALRLGATSGHSYAVLGMLEDKDARGTVLPLVAVFDEWFVAGLRVPRGANAQTLRDALRAVHPQAKVHMHVGIADAYRAALARAGQSDRVVAFGSFHTVAEVLLAEQESSAGCASS